VDEAVFADDTTVDPSGAVYILWVGVWAGYETCSGQSDPAATTFGGGFETTPKMVTSSREHLNVSPCDTWTRTICPLASRTCVTDRPSGIAVVSIHPVSAVTLAPDMTSIL